MYCERFLLCGILYGIFVEIFVEIFAGDIFGVR